MANVESSAPVIDFEVLLNPISEERPSGEPMQYTGLYDEIREARRADDSLVSQGDWKTDLKVADFRKVVSLAIPALSTQTKDIQICVWLCEALASQHGFVGFRDGLRLLRQVEENFWETCYPEIDEGDMEARANAIDWLDKQLSVSIKKIILTPGQGLNYMAWEESQNFNIPESIETLPFEAQEKMKALKKQADDEKRTTGDMWRSAANAGNRAFYEQLNLNIDECWAELKSLDKTNEEQFDRNQMPSMRELEKSLDGIRTVTGKLLEEKRIAEPDAAAEEEASETMEEGEDGEMVVLKKGGAPGAIQNRQDALKRLSDLADYFKKNEPQSPVSYLVQRAVKWGNMPLEAWLQDVIKDDTMILNLRQTLGFNTNVPDESKP